MKYKRTAAFTIIVDTREQLPYDLEDSIVGTLQTGDYSILGYTDICAIERKSLADLFGSVTQGRERFEREVERLSQLRFAAVVIEASMGDILRGCPNSSANPEAVLATVLSWQAEYRIPFVFAGNREGGKAFVERQLNQYARLLQREAKEKAANG